MSDEQLKKTPAQIRAEKRRARILGRGSAGASQISGDRIAPGLDFPQPGTGPTGAGNEEFEKQIEKIMANSTCDGTKRNLATSPNQMANSRAAPRKSAGPPPLNPIVKVFLCLVLNVACYFLRVNYGYALGTSAVILATLHFLGFNTVFAPPVMINMLSGVLKIGALGAYFVYSMFEYLLLHGFSVGLIHLVASKMNGIEAVYSDPAESIPQNPAEKYQETVEAAEEDYSHDPTDF